MSHSIIYFFHNIFFLNAVDAKKKISHSVIIDLRWEHIARELNIREFKDLFVYLIDVTNVIDKIRYLKFITSRLKKNIFEELTCPFVEVNLIK